MDIFYAWLASVVSGIEPLIIKASSKNLVKNPWLFNILWLSALLPFTMTFAYVQGGTLPVDWGSLVGVGVFSAAFYALYTAALYTIDVSVMAPLFSLRTIFSVLIGVWVFGEALSGVGWLLVGLIVAASPLATYDETRRFKGLSGRALWPAVVAMASLAVMSYFVKVSYAHNGFATTLLWQDIIALVLLLPALFHPAVRNETITRRKLLPFVALGVAGFVYNASTIVAYGHNLAISSVIVSLPLSMVFVWLLSRQFGQFFEQHPPKVYYIRFTGAIVMVACAIWLSFVS